MYVTQWYILAAVFWFPWLYTVAVLMIFWVPATGVIEYQPVEVSASQAVSGRHIQ